MLADRRDVYCVNSCLSGIPLMKVQYLGWNMFVQMKKCQFKIITNDSSMVVRSGNLHLENLIYRAFCPAPALSDLIIQMWYGYQIKSTHHRVQQNHWSNGSLSWGPIRGIPNMTFHCYAFLRYGRRKDISIILFPWSKYFPFLKVNSPYISSPLTMINGSFTFPHKTHNVLTFLKIVWYLSVLVCLCNNYHI